MPTIMDMGTGPGANKETTTAAKATKTKRKETSIITRATSTGVRNMTGRWHRGKATTGVIERHRGKATTSVTDRHRGITVPLPRLHHAIHIWAMATATTTSTTRGSTK